MILTYEFVANWRNKDRFPTFDALPYDNDFNRKFYAPGYDGIVRPRWHWCFLVEVVEDLRWLRPAYRVKDLAGRLLIVAFHTKDRSPEIHRECRIGDTMAIMYANSHLFMDGNVGIRVEVGGATKVFHCSLATFMGIGDVIHTTLADEIPKCRACNNPGKYRCTKCTMRYCSKECQVADWNPKHKAECRIGRQIVQWRSFDWRKFDRWRGFS